MHVCMHVHAHDRSPIMHTPCMHCNLYQLLPGRACTRHTKVNENQDYEWKHNYEYNYHAWLHDKHTGVYMMNRTQYLMYMMPRPGAKVAVSQKEYLESVCMF